MRVRRTYIKWSGLLLLVMATVIITTAFFLPQLVDINSYKSEIIALLEQQLHRKVSFKRGEFTLRYGAPSFIFDGVTVSQADRSGNLFTAGRITIRLALIPLLQKQISLSALTLGDAEISLVRSADGHTNIDDLLKPTPGSQPLTLSKIRFQNSVVNWHDLAVSSAGWRGSARISSLTLDHLQRGSKGKLELLCEIPALQGGATKLALTGNVTLPAAGKPLADTAVKLTVELGNGEINRFWPYVGRFIPFAPIGGRLDWSGSCNGTVADFSAKGRLQLAGSSLVWPGVFHSAVNPKTAQLEYDLKGSKHRLEIKAFKFSADGLKVKGACQLLDLGSKDPRIVASATTEQFRLEDFHRFIPYGIIADDAANYIEQHVTGGLFTLENGTLDGRVSQILHMEKGTNYNILHIKGKVDKGIISYGSQAPLFHGIKGGLELVGKDFLLKGMSGAFGTSPFTMEGRITDYPLDAPCQYPFTMDMTPNTPEVAWLARFVRGERLQFVGDSRLHLKGSGYTKGFNLVGNWELKQAAYSYPDLVKKPLGMNNTLQFSAILGASETRISSLTYVLPPLNLSASGLFRYGGKPYLRYEFQTNSFAMGDALPIATLWQQYRPRGGMQAHVTSSGNPEDFSAMDYRGTLSFNGFSLTPAPQFKSVNAINGTVTFKGNSLESSRIAARYGDSELLVKGVVKDLQSGEAELSFSSPQLLLRDIGLAPSNSASAIGRMQGVVGRRDGITVIKGLSGMFKQSNFNLSGTHSSGVTPKVELAITSSKLSIDDLKELLNGSEARKGTTAKAGQENVSPVSTEVALSLNAENGVYGDLQFSRLQAQLSRVGGIYYLQQMGAQLYGGSVSAKGRIDPLGEGSRYDLTFDAQRINAEKLLQALRVSREVRGTLRFSGNLTARGSSLTDIKKTALGNIRLELEEGSLKRFSLLSKLFSILNVSQLLKFQLPDMVSNGMPYNQINGSFAVSDGSLATKDLKIASDAINMSLVGKADIVKETLAFTIGVQPLQTVDKIVKHIPVVGWLLTGKDKDFVTVYFEATGPWGDPKVSAIPVKSMSKGVLNIFRRVFELPVRLFTDTGEVLLGQ